MKKTTGILTALALVGTIAVIGCEQGGQKSGEKQGGQAPSSAPSVTSETTPTSPAPAGK